VGGVAEGFCKAVELSDTERDQLLELVWGDPFGVSGDQVKLYVGYLRRKLEDGDRPRLIETVRGVGYVLRAKA
jgi:two-component system response regulator PrrA